MTSPHLIRKDRDIIAGITMQFAYRGNASVAFQFPPTIESDSRRVEWKVMPAVPGFDPLVKYQNNSSREMSIRIEYIVESSGGAGPGLWDIDRIKYNVNLIKGYFSGLRDGQGVDGGGSMVVRFRHTRITGTSVWSMRMGNVNVSYAGPQIGAGATSHPLKTIITADLATVSNSDTDKVWWNGIRRYPEFDDLWY